MALKDPSIDRFPKLAVPNEGLSPEAAFVTKDGVFNVHLEALAWRGSLGSYIFTYPSIGCRAIARGFSRFCHKSTFL